MTQQLSPAAQAVLDAFDAKQDEMHEVTWLTRNPDRDCIAAALRAAADQVVPLQLPPETAVDANHPTVEWHVWNAEQQSRFALLAIANELEAQ